MRADLLRIIVRGFLYRDKHARLRIASYVVHLCAIRAGKRGARMHICAIRDIIMIIALSEESVWAVSIIISCTQRRMVVCYSTVVKTVCDMVPIS